jgi:hypothetical protein
MAGERNRTGPVHGPRTHDIGAGGVVSVFVEADDVRIRGVDGTKARVVAPADGAGIETHVESGRFTVRTAGSARGTFMGLRIGGREFGVRLAGTVELEVPRGARVEVSSAAGDVALRDVGGDAQVRTVSGDVSIEQAAGRLVVDVATGDVTVAGTGPISLDVHAVSGSVRARAPRFDRIAIETISGDADLAGAFGTDVAHLISTVSGCVELAVTGGLTVEVKTVSGDVTCDHPDRREGDGRTRPLVIGDGVARLAVRSMSGDVEVRAGRAAPVRAAPSSPSSPPAGGASAAGGASDAATLAVLEALARGEIDVVEAERRLAGVPAAPEAAARA